MNKWAMGILLVIIAGCCGGIFWIEMERRAEGISARREAIAMAAINAQRNEVNSRLETLREIINERVQQVELLDTYLKVELISEPEKKAIWEEYESEYDEAWRLLNATNVDFLTVTIPSRKYREQERAAENRRIELVKKEKTQEKAKTD